MANNGLSAKGMVLAAITGIVLVLYDPMLAVGFCLGVFVGAVWVRHDVIVAKREGRMIEVDSPKQ